MKVFYLCNGKNMQHTKQIKIGDFSNLDIWRIEADQDSFLNDYYVEIPAYKELTLTNKFGVVGRKGTGKSALKQMFYERMPNYNCFVEDFQFSSIFNPSFFDELIYSYEEHGKSYIDLIKYVLLIRVMMLIVSDHSLDGKFIDDVNKFLELNGYKAENLGSLYKTVKETNNIKISKEIGFTINMGVFNLSGKGKRDTNTDIIELDYRKILDSLFDIVLTNMNNLHQYNLLIDKIDDLWTTYFEIYDNVVLNFTRAVIEFNASIRKKLGQNTKTRIIIFLREDLLNRLRGKDANFNKFMQDELIKIDWQTSYKTNGSLLNELINKRIVKALQLNGHNINEYQKPFINNVLKNSDIIMELKRRKFYKSEFNSFIKKVFYNRTYLRPRDVVKFFHFLSKAYDVFDFQNEYSEYLWEEVDNELNPILYDVERTKKTLRKICQGKSGTFNSKEFIKIYENQNYRNIKEDKDTHFTAQETLEKLFEYSVIGNRSLEYNSSQYNYETSENYIKIQDVRFKYRENSKIDFDFDKKCIIHAGLYQALGIQTQDL